MSKVTLLKGDCLQKLKELKDNTIDAVVTDPPYEIGFMGKGWDDSGIANNPELWKEVLRVLKPGGHLLSFSHSRTYHRQAVAVEDAGFEIRDQIMWIYGSGFPKSHNIGKAVDKLQGNEREFVGLGASQPAKSGHFAGSTADSINYTEDKSRYNPPVTKGNSEWEGWGTALKPAHEPIVMARKPFKGSVAQNVLEWGTGGINIDESRIGYKNEDDLDKAIEKRKSFANTGGGHQTKYVGGELKNPIDTTQSINTQGRFPANIIFDEEAGKILDEQSGNRKGFSGGGGPTRFGGATGGKKLENYNYHNDEGGASRFFYCPKASKKDRNEGCDELEEKMSGHNKYDKCGKCGKYLLGQLACECEEPERTYIASKNNHPTVKPTDLMAYLVRMVTPKGGTVLDPFMGSGSTGKAAVREGFNFIGIEREDEYMEIAKSRIEHEQKKHKHRQFFDAI